jgi:hypothetical protein
MSTNTDDDPERAAVESDPLFVGKVEETESFLEDCWDTITLGVPIFLSMLSWVGVSKFVHATYLRHHSVHRSDTKQLVLNFYR